MQVPLVLAGLAKGMSSLEGRAIGVARMSEIGFRAAGLALGLGSAWAVAHRLRERLAAFRGS